MGNLYKPRLASVAGIAVVVQLFGGILSSASALPQVPHAEINLPVTNTLLLRGLNKITGEPADIIAPIGKPVRFATLSITARYCYSTPPSEAPETVAFLQIDDYRPDQSPKRVFSGWMWASSPDLNALDHPLYDVWVISCRSSMPNETPSAVASLVPDKVHPPVTTDSETSIQLPKDAGR